MNDMIQTIHAWLNRPFPFSELPVTKVRTSILFGLFIFMFLAFFQPFGIEGISHHKYLFLAGFGLITMIVMLLTFFALPALFPTFFDLDQWRVQNHILFSLNNVLWIALLNWLYNNQVGESISEVDNLLYFLVVTLGVGIIPIVVLTLILERKLWKKNHLMAQDFSKRLEAGRSPEKSDEPINLVGENTNECFKLSQNQLICIGSEGNYSKVYYQDQGKVEERLMRIPLKKVEDHLDCFDQIVRCHRSFIVNLQQIASVSGNARSFKLHMADLDFTIPVSRSFPKATLSQLKTVQG
jgi:LytTr DNA-binding domain-containing protein